MLKTEEIAKIQQEIQRINSLETQNEKMEQSYNLKERIVKEFKDVLDEIFTLLKF